jgi:hypothetical protein
MGTESLAIGVSCLGAKYLPSQATLLMSYYHLSIVLSVSKNNVLEWDMQLQSGDNGEKLW